MARGRGTQGQTPSSSLELVLQNPSGLPGISLRLIRPWLTALVDHVCPQASSLAVRFTGDREMRRVNRTYRHKDTTTDVLSFPGGATPEGLHLGDLVISVPTARRQARVAGHATGREVEILLLHGVLHLMGYDHETDQGEMNQMERRLGRRFLRPPSGARGRRSHPVDG